MDQLITWVTSSRWYITQAKYAKTTAARPCAYQSDIRYHHSPRLLSPIDLLCLKASNSWYFSLYMGKFNNGEILQQSTYCTLTMTIECLLNHCGIVTPYGDIDVDQHWLRLCLGGWLLISQLSGIHLRAISCYFHISHGRMSYDVWHLWLLQLLPSLYNVHQKPFRWKAHKFGALCVRGELGLFY